MIVLRKIEQIDAATVRLEVYADAVSELANTPIPGVPTDMNIQPGSYAYDANGNLAIYNSSNAWNVVEN